ncbi:MAG: class I SAM-dependent methyltransferase [Verrucomicrobia bacterium]|nr:class I SAM-dependent methyltransferase [Verrucomicrobiota bacterium]
MENSTTKTEVGERNSFITCRNSQGLEIRATPLRMTRYLVVFEVYNPYSILQLSEVLQEFKIVMNDRVVYSGRAVASNLVNTGLVLICEATLDEGWIDVDVVAPVHQPEKLQEEFREFLKEWEKIYRVTPEFKVVIAEIQTLLADLRRWMEQVELGVRSAAGNRQETEREVIKELQQPLLPTVNSIFGRFEKIAESVPQDLQPLHRTYVKRQIHPLVLCSPFAYRTYQKPLGYAGDYEMVNMIMRSPHEGSSLFAKTVNLWFWNQAPAEAHRNRIHYLTARLDEETQRVVRLGRGAKILNLGCGPAGEIQRFLSEYDICDRANFTLLDFNDETLQHTGKLLDELKRKYSRMTPIQMVKKSVHQVLKDGSRNNGSEKFDLVYCAGLFDYLSDRICKRLMNIFYDMLAPGGLLIATNVDASNPNRQTMEYVLEWHLIYRNSAQLNALNPDNATPGSFTVKADITGVNIYLEVRKP